MDKLKVWFMPPEWSPPGVAAAAMEAVEGRPRFEVSTSRRMALYVGVAGVLTLAVTVLFLVRSRSLTQPVRLAFAGWFALEAG